MQDQSQSLKSVTLVYHICQQLRIEATSAAKTQYATKTNF
jgi:hypothetical protein